MIRFITKTACHMTRNDYVRHPFIRWFLKFVFSILPLDGENDKQTNFCKLILMSFALFTCMEQEPKGTDTDFLKLNQGILKLCNGNLSIIGSRMNPLSLMFNQLFTLKFWSVAVTHSSRCRFSDLGRSARCRRYKGILNSV